MILWFLIGLLGCRQPMDPNQPPPAQDPTQAWGEVLATVVTEDGYVDYDLLEANRAPLDDYVAWISQNDLFSKDKMTAHRHAFWLNTFNALTMFQILEREQPESIQDVPGLPIAEAAGFFVWTSFDIARNQTSLAEIRDERIRWREMDFRSHAAMNFGATSCPPMSAELYTGEQLFSQLRKQLNRWVSDEERGLRFEGDQLLVNPLFDVYKRDFDFFSAGLDLCTIAARHAAPQKANRLRKHSEIGCPYGTFDFDWSLNHAQ